MIDISIIMPVYNAGTYLAKALDSVIAQTYDHSKMELITVDDGSTDGSGEVLDRYAERYPFMKVIHQANTGTASAPRNRGLELAQGEFVFFCDNDDSMGELAVEKMLAHAREWNSDVLLAKLVGVGGRKAPASMFNQNQPVADLYNSRITWTLGPWKLFRRSMIEEFGLRFPEDSLSEDIIFVLGAYFHAKVISVAADYDYYFYAHREDGQNITLGSVWKKIDLRVRGVERIFELIERYADPEQRDPVLLLRLFRDEVVGVVRLLPHCPPEDREHWLQVIRDCVLPYYNERNSATIPLDAHLVLDAMAKGDLPLIIEVVEAGQDVYSKVKISYEDGRTLCTFTSATDSALFVTTDVSEILPSADYQLKSVEWRGRSLTLSGSLTLQGVVEGEPSVSFVLQDFADETKSYALPVRLTPVSSATRSELGVPVDEHAWESTVDLTTFRGVGHDDASEAAGGSVRWDFYLAVSTVQQDRMIRLGAKRDDDVETAFFANSPHVGERIFAPYQTGFRNISLQEISVESLFTDKPFTLEWDDRSKGRLRLKGELVGKKLPGGVRVMAALDRADHGEAHAREKVFSAEATDDALRLIPAKVDGKRFAATLAIGMVNGGDPLASGEWDISIVAQVGDQVMRVPHDITLPEVKHSRFRRMLHFYSLKLDAEQPRLRVHRII